MTKNEAKIRGRITALMNSPNAVDVRHAENITRALDALLAEQRAEVERLKETIRAAHTEVAALQAQLSGASEAIHSARNAALEEAVSDLRKHVAAAKELGLLGRGQVFHDALEVVAALKPRPAGVVPVAKVREVIAEMANTDWRNLPHAAGRKEGEALVYFLARELGVRLGIELDAKAEEDPGHPCRVCRPKTHTPTSGVCACPCPECVAYREAKVDGTCPGYECDVVPGDACANCGRPLTQHPEPRP